MIVVDLTSDDLTWFEASIAGAELPARMSMLHQDADRGVRSVLVDFPDGWRRDAVGTQPAAEEMLPLSGSLSISGVTASPGQLLVIEPRALRAATSTTDGTRAVVFFTGAGGGWMDGEELVTGEKSLHDLGEGLVRGPRPGFAGLLEWRDEVRGATFFADAEVVWVQAQQYAFVPAGQRVPDVAGAAVVRILL
ncbi:hypothetical protein [Nocardioides gilvus]|uniref:hypothetical protein n=1 Tax=Nocardioides gilvus TaxID=1735589 RepID=UPI000D74D061|nr:hypothetical protein [Nocardioides gilvus]